jgi:restriction system protein
MAFPTQTELEIPLLQLLDSLGGEAIPRNIYDRLAQQFPGITESDLQLRMDAGAVKWWNHVQWARQKLVQYGEIDGSVRGVWRITDKGRQRLREGGRSHRTASATIPVRQQTVVAPATENGQVPGEVIESAHRELRDALSEELLQTIMSSTPAFFEQLVVDLLVKMGYGGSRKDAGQAVGGVADGGIDGIIKEDRLGLGLIYVQAKRWDRRTPVGSPEVQRFAGALQGKRAQKGVFITTSSFTKDATEFVAHIEPKIVLIDGRELTRLMIDFGVGVATVATYEIKRVDSDYFGEE